MNITRWAGILSLSLLSAGPLFAWSDGQDAVMVIGQADYTSATLGPNNMSPESMAYDPLNKRLFVADTFQNRVLVYDMTNPLAPVGPLFFLGQLDPFSIGAHSNNSPSGLPTTDREMALVKGVAYDTSTAVAPQGRLFVSDAMNNRVLVFDFHAHSSIPGTPGGIQTGMVPDYVLGQSGAATYAPGGGDSGLNNPNGLAYDAANRRLFVSDRGNNRVVIFDLTTLVSNQPAKWVLGQKNFTDTTLGPVGPGTMTPEYLAYDHTAGAQRLFVADEGYIRIMVFTAPPSGPGSIPVPVPPLAAPVSAIRELGQANLSAPPVTTAGPNRLGYASGATYDQNTKTLFVADEDNNRMLIFDVTGGITDGMDAVNVLGQFDFTANTSNIGQSSLSHVEDALYIPSTPPLLLVADTGNNRILGFIGPPPQCTGLELICGTITSAEDATLKLPNVPVELRSSEGKLLATKKTGTSGLSLGYYSFSASDTSELEEDNSYYVTPIIGRTQSAIPMYSAVTSLPSTGVLANFRVRGVPGKFQLSGLPPSSFVLISTFPYTGAAAAQPPTLSPGRITSYFSATVGPTQSAEVLVPKGTSYYLTCWLAQPAGATTQYQRVPDIFSPVNGPYTMSPPLGVPLTCI